MINDSPINSAPINAAYSGEVTADVTGAGFAATPTIVMGQPVGRGFFWSVSIIGVPTSTDTVTGRGFSAPVAIYGGAVSTGLGFQSAPVIAGTGENTGYVTGSGFRTVASISMTGIEGARITGRGFSAALTAFSGATVVGRGFLSPVDIATEVPQTTTVIGRGFAAAPVITAVYQTSITVNGRGFASSIYYSRIAGGGFAAKANIVFEYTAAYAEAVILNLRTNAVSRYQNFPFLHLARIGDQYYGFDSDGLYLLSGATDEDTDVNGTIHGKAHDFGVFNSKNVPYMYLNGDDSYTVTGYVDSETQPSFVSGFTGRRVKLARGNKGRYWSFKIEGIQKLQGVEIMPDQLSRRVK